MALDSTVLQNCPDCRVQKQTFFVRYRDFLLSRDTLLTFGNALLLIAGFVVTNIFGQLAPGKLLYLASALLGGIPLFIFTARQVFVKRDITAGVMASVAVIAAIIVKEYSAAALVVFMMSVGEWLENFTIARADNALKDLASLIPSTITVRRDGNEIVIPIDQLKLDETVLVHAGERFGVDGVVSRGNQLCKPISDHRRIYSCG